MLVQESSTGLTEAQISAIDVVERVSSAISIFGVIFIISSFSLSRRFRRPVNRLIFFASFGNVFSNLATSIGRSGIEKNVGLKSSPLCLFQGFLIQTFMPADALFALFMAINVYLNVKHKFEALSLRNLELYYISISYLLPFTVGFVLVFIKNESKGPVYGDALLWCWISRQWDVLRIPAFYGPVWFIVVTTFLIYAFTFRIILRLRKSLRHFRAEEKLRKSQKNALKEEQKQRNGQPLASSNALPYSGQLGGTTENNSILTQPQKPANASAPAISFVEPVRASAVINSMYKSQNSQSSNESDEMKYDIDAEELAAPPVIDVEAIAPSEPTHVAFQRARTAMRANRAAWAYARCSMLFFCGLIITWLPSSMNRVYQYVHDDTNFVLSLLSALVLPGQGFWNLIIYTSMSWRSCRSLWRDFKHNIHGRRPKIGISVKVRVEGCARGNYESSDDES